MSNRLIKASIITIGDEILVGQTVDTNSTHIAKELYLLGIPVQEILSISDEESAIIEALDRSIAKSELIIVTGGLGPTKDDLTKHCLTKYFKDELVLNTHILGRIESYFKYINREMLEVHRQQAMLPKKSKIIENDLGTASGMWFEKSNAVVVSFPGVPYEMKGLLQKCLPLFKDYFGTGNFYHRTLMTIGIGETAIAIKIEELETNLRNQKIGVAYLPSPGAVKIRFTGNKNQQETIDNSILKASLILEKYAYGFDDISIERHVGELLKSKKMNLSTVESCTGGAIASKIVSVPNASEYFKGSIVAYSNAIKMNEVGVDSDIIEKYGAVSEQCVIQLAEKGRIKMKTEYCIAVSGIAGPDGGSDEKPVGTVWIAISSSKSTSAKLFNFKQNRERNIDLSVLNALNELRIKILNE